jgi:hypothetical protein
LIHQFVGLVVRCARLFILFVREHFTVTEKLDTTLLDAQIAFLRREINRLGSLDAPWADTTMTVLQGIVETLTTVRRQIAMTGMSGKPIDRPEAFVVRGCNDIYQGWLSRVLCQPHDETKSIGWRSGWKMAFETDNPEIVLIDEINLKHIIVEKS